MPPRRGSSKTHQLNLEKISPYSIVPPMQDVKASQASKSAKWARAQGQSSSRRLVRSGDAAEPVTKKRRATRSTTTLTTVTQLPDAASPHSQPGQSSSTPSVIMDSSAPRSKRNGEEILEENQGHRLSRKRRRFSESNKAIPPENATPERPPLVLSHNQPEPIFSIAKFVGAITMVGRKAALSELPRLPGSSVMPRKTFRSRHLAHRKGPELQYTSRASLLDKSALHRKHLQVICYPRHGPFRTVQNMRIVPLNDFPLPFERLRSHTIFLRPATGRFEVAVDDPNEAPPDLPRQPIIHPFTALVRDSHGRNVERDCFAHHPNWIRQPSPLRNELSPLLARPLCREDTELSKEGELAPIHNLRRGFPPRRVHPASTAFNSEGIVPNYGTS